MKAKCVMMCLLLLLKGVLLFRAPYVGKRISRVQLNAGTDAAVLSDTGRKELWKKVSKLEREAVETLAEFPDDDVKKAEAYKKLALSISLKSRDPFMRHAQEYYEADANGDEQCCKAVMNKMSAAGVPPHIANVIEKAAEAGVVAIPASFSNEYDENELAQINDEGLTGVGDEDVDLSSTFSDTVTEKIRVKVNSFYDSEKSDPANGKFMFFYKVAIYNEGPEPVQIVARMWEIEKVGGAKETVRGAGIMSTQPIIPAGDMFSYQSVCPLKVFPPSGKRVLGSMSGTYTICKGNMGQVNFAVKVGKFSLILPQDVVID